MKTSRLEFNEAEGTAIISGLESIVNILVMARQGYFPRIDPRVQFLTVNGPGVYARAEFSEAMAAHMLSAWNKLKWINPSRKVRLNCFELAALAFAYRMAIKEELAPEDVLAKVPGLADKLERYRKRAKRAAIKQIGRDAYGEQAECWRRFLQYVHSILCFRPTLRKSSALLVFHRDRREKLLALAAEVAPTADPVQLRHLVDLAKSEVLRDRHLETLGLLVENDTRGREFMARFLLKRIDPELLAPEFQTLDIRQSAREERLRSVMVLDAPDWPADEVQVTETTGEEHRDAIEVPLPSVESLVEAPVAPLLAAIPKTLPTQREVSEHYAGWLLDEADPEDWAEISKNIQYLAWNATARYTREATSKTIAEAIVEAKPVETKPVCVAVLSIEVQRNDVPMTSFDIANFYAEWGVRWLLAVRPDLGLAYNATVEGMRLAREKLALLDVSAQKCKLDEIYRRYHL